MSSNYFLNSECQIQDPVILSPVGQHSTIYRAKLANGQQVPVIPVSHIQIADPGQHFFRPVSPLGHIYMEIDPVYARLDPELQQQQQRQSELQQHQHMQSELQLSDVSDDDLRRSSDISRQSSNRYAEERPLIRSTGLRRSAPNNSRPTGPVRTVSAGCAGSLRAGSRNRGAVQGHPGLQLDTPITIALSPGGEQFVSLNMDRQHQQQRQQGIPFPGHHTLRSFNSGV